MIINVESSCAASYFCGNRGTHFISVFVRSKEQHLFETKIFNNINVFIAMFDQFLTS